MFLGEVRSINIGMPEPIAAPDGKPLTSAIRKQPVAAPVEIVSDGLVGDASYDESHHGPNMTIHAFSLDHYAYFEQQAGRALPRPAFGENLSLAGGTEDRVCAGDIVQLGSAVLEITQPTERCATIGRSLGLPQMLKWIQATLKTGYYLRVLEPGTISAGNQLALLERPNPGWTIDRLNRAMFRELDDEAQVRRLQALGGLSPDWKTRLLVHFNRWAQA